MPSGRTGPHLPWGFFGAEVLGVLGGFKLWAVSAVVMGIAQTLTKERIFAPLRERLGGHETFLGYLVSCPYCASHYIAFVLVPLTGTYPLDVAPHWGFLSSLLRWFLSSILVTVLAAFLRVGFWLVDESQALTRRRKEVVARAEAVMPETPARPPPLAPGQAHEGDGASPPPLTLSTIEQSLPLFRLSSTDNFCTVAPSMSGRAFRPRPEGTS